MAQPPRPDPEPVSLEILQLMHDLRNQLMIMRLSASGIPEESPHRADRLGQLQQSVERAVLLINGLLAEGHSHLPARGPVDANEVVRRTAATLAATISDTIRLKISLWPEPLAVIADTGDLDRLVLNLALNAFDAMPEGGEVTIKTAIAHFSGVGDASSSGPYVRLTVRDTGHGMTAEVKHRMFDPFFTTKKGGTGLGLRSVAFTVQELHGQISVDSEPGRGTAVTVLLPLARERR